MEAELQVFVVLLLLMVILVVGVFRNRYLLVSAQQVVARMLVVMVSEGV
jgi:hypothetical protein